MKIDNKIERKFRKTTKGRKLYMMNIASYVLYALSVVFLIIIIVNKGKELTTLLSVVIILSFICVLIATIMCLTYYYSLQIYDIKNKK